MLQLITVIITIVCIFLVFVVLIQNPKGGGLGASFGGVSSNLFGHQRTTNFLEKATWYLAIGLIVLSLSTKFAIDTTSNDTQPGLEIKSDLNDEE